MSTQPWTSAIVNAAKAAGIEPAALLAVVEVETSGAPFEADGVTPRPRDRIRTASGCTSLAAAGREIRAIVERSVQDNDLRAALVRVDRGDRSIARVSVGESMDGVPANLRMNFRVGSVAIPYVIDLLLQLQDDGRLSLDAGAAGDRAGTPAHLRAGGMLSLCPHELHHPRQRDRGGHRQAGGGAAPQARPPPARLAQHQDLLAAGHPAAGSARVHCRPRSL